jgi:hypothetical protein
MPGRYCGNTLEGPPICLVTTADATALESIEVSLLPFCGSGHEGFRGRLDFAFNGVGTPIQSDLSFSFSNSGPLTSASSELTNIQASLAVIGKFTTDGRAAGTLTMQLLTFDFDRLHWNCSDSARLAGPHKARLTADPKWLLSRLLYRQGSQVQALHRPLGDMSVRLAGGGQRDRQCGDSSAARPG